MYTLDQAASLLGLRTPWMLRKCLKNASISPVSSPGDRRRKLLTDDDLDALRRTRDTLWPLARSAPQVTAQPVDVGGRTFARLEALERRVASLEMQLARRATPMPLPADAPPSVPSDVPDGAQQLGPFATLAGIPETTLRRWVERGEVEAIPRPSAKPGQTERWVTQTGQQQARERLARRSGA